MKKLLPVLCFSALISAASAQGLINFFNNANTLVSASGPSWDPPPTWTIGSYYFALLTSPVGGNNFTFAGVYGTNQAAAGRFSGGVGVAVNGWAPGTARDFEVVGWTASEGATFNPAWLFVTPPFGYFGFSSVGTGIAGGATPSGGVLPNLNIFGGATGIQAGFVFLGPIPEPSATSLVGFGTVLLMIFRRRIRPELTHAARPRD